MFKNELTLLKKIIADVKVFARTSPKQKEHVITILKSLGYFTLMCGDGTNDVGALKHADVGVALLSSVPANSAEIEQKKKAKLSEVQMLSNQVNTARTAMTGAPAIRSQQNVLNAQVIMNLFFLQVNNFLRNEILS